MQFGGIPSVQYVQDSGFCTLYNKIIEKLEKVEEKEEDEEQEEVLMAALKTLVNFKGYMRSHLLSPGLS